MGEVLASLGAGLATGRGGRQREERQWQAQQQQQQFQRQFAAAQLQSQNRLAAAQLAENYRQFSLSLREKQAARHQQGKEFAEQMAFREKWTAKDYELQAGRFQVQALDAYKDWWQTREAVKHMWESLDLQRMTQQDRTALGWAEHNAQAEYLKNMGFAATLNALVNKERAQAAGDLAKAQAELTRAKAWLTRITAQFESLPEVQALRLSVLKSELAFKQMQPDVSQAEISRIQAEIQAMEARTSVLLRDATTDPEARQRHYSTLLARGNDLQRNIAEQTTTLRQLAASQGLDPSQLLMGTPQQLEQAASQLGVVGPLTELMLNMKNLKDIKEELAAVYQIQPFGAVTQHEMNAQQSLQAGTFGSFGETDEQGNPIPGTDIRNIWGDVIGTVPEAARQPEQRTYYDWQPSAYSGQFHSRARQAARGVPALGETWP